MCGIAVTCLLIGILGGVFYSSADWFSSWTDCIQIGLPQTAFRWPVCYQVSPLSLLAAWSGCVVAGVMGIEFCLLKLWAAWEEVHQGAARVTRRSRRQ